MYKVIRNQDRSYQNKAGTMVTVIKPCEYSIHFVNEEDNIHVLDIRDYLQNPRGVAEGICKALNKGEVILDLAV